MASVDEYFSVVALFILFRETIEASIICGVLLQFLARARPALKRSVWWGVAAGVGISIIFGVIFIVVYYTAQNNLFKGKNRDWFKGIISWIAAALITYLGFAMLRFLGWEEKWKRKLGSALAAKVPMAIDGQPGLAPLPAQDGADKDAAAAGPRPDDALAPAKDVHGLPPAKADPVTADAVDVESKMALAADSDDPKATVALAAPDAAADAAAPALVDEPTRKDKMKIFMLVFTTVVREGIESVVFLGGLGNVKLSAVPLAALVGITSGVLVGVFLFYSGRQVKDLKWLIIIMSVIIFFIAAGQVNLGTDALMRAGLFGHCSPWYDERPWAMRPLYDWSHCCNDIDPTGNEPTDVQNRRRFFALARAIFGYQDKGTFLEVIIYCGYWLVIFIIAGYKAWNGSLLDADHKYKRQQRKLAEQAAKEAAADAERLAVEAKLLEEGDAAPAGKAVDAAEVSSSGSPDTDGLSSSETKDSEVALQLPPPPVARISKEVL